MSSLNEPGRQCLPIASSVRMAWTPFVRYGRNSGRIMCLCYRSSPATHLPLILNCVILEILGEAAAGKIRVELVSRSRQAKWHRLSRHNGSEWPRGEIDSMFVEEQFRGHGIGSQLVRHALAWMDDMEATSKVVTVAHANEAALTFYSTIRFSASDYFAAAESYSESFNG